MAHLRSELPAHNIAAQVHHFNPFAGLHYYLNHEAAQPKPPSLIVRVSCVVGDVMVRGLSYLFTSKLLSPDWLLKSVIYNITSTACLNKIFSSDSYWQTAQSFVMAIKNLCDQKHIVDTFTSQNALEVVNSVFANTGFKAAVVCDALFHAIYGCVADKKMTFYGPVSISEKKDKVANFLILLASAFSIFECAGNVFNHHRDDFDLTTFLKSSYSANDTALNFLANLATNTAAFALYKGFHHFFTSLLSASFKLSVANKNIEQALNIMEGHQQ